MDKEAADGLKDERPYAGVHILATALLCAASSTADELELARRLLERDPRRDAPRETESVAGTFNRHMDAAIDSVNDSVGEPTRVGRRARLAADLGRAGLVLVDRATLAGMIATIAELRAELARVDGEDLGAELLEADPCSNPYCADVESCSICGKGNGHAHLAARETDGILSLGPPRYDPDDDAGVVALDFIEGAERSAELDPSVNDQVRGLLTARRREHIPDNERPTFVCKRVGDRWGVAVLHGGREIHWWPLEEARRAGTELISLANLAARPGELPLEELG